VSARKPRESTGNAEPSRGDRFGAAVRAKYEPNLAESELLTEVCRLIDLCDTLAAAIDRDGAMVPGSVGQPRVHPAVGQLTSGRLALGRLLSTLGLPNRKRCPPGGDSCPAGQRRPLVYTAERICGERERDPGGDDPLAWAGGRKCVSARPGRSDLRS
jgi:hypothetical protein